MKFKGVWQIFMFNRPFYLWTLAGWLVLVSLLRWMPDWLSPLALAAAVATAWWWLASLAVSHYVYDRSGLYDWRWMVPFVSEPRAWVNVHAGLDETTPSLRRLFPTNRATVLDIYTQGIMTEPSIERARRLLPSIEPAISCQPDAWPLADASADAAFIIFAAHEIRSQEGRIRFFAEVRRVLVPGGRAVVVEHLRDAWNALAFGPGALHFWSARTWEDAMDHAGLTVVRRLTRTPFVQVWVLEP